jgi:hypothetical protein
MNPSAHGDVVALGNTLPCVTRPYSTQPRRESALRVC